MLEVLYDTTNNEVRGWCADENQFGLFQPKPNEAVVILPIDLPDYDSDEFYVDLNSQTIYGEPIEPKCPLSRHLATIIGANIGVLKPLQVRRDCDGIIEEYWCFVTQDIVDAYQAGQLQIGDYVIVDFLDNDNNRPVASQKVYKTW